MSIASTLIAISLLAGGNSVGSITDEHVDRLMGNTSSVPVIRVACSFKKFLSNPGACENDGGFSSVSRSRDNDDDHGNDDDGDDDHGGDSDGDHGGDSSGGDRSNDGDSDGADHGDNSDGGDHDKGDDD